MLSEETTLLKIYSLFVLVDGKWTPSIKENLDEIAKSLKVNKNEANEIYGDSRASVWSSLPEVNLSDDYSFEVMLVIQRVIKVSKQMCFGIWFCLDMMMANILIQKKR